MDFKDIISTYQFDGKLKKYCNQLGLDNLIQQMIKFINSTEDDDDFSTALAVALDLTISSDLTEEDILQYLSLLNKYSFFENLEKYLYHEKLSRKVSTIFTIGKFSLPENLKYLEDAFEKDYYMNNPILSARCLGEMKWLDSEKYYDLSIMVLENHDLINFMTIGLENSTIVDDEDKYNELIAEYSEVCNTFHNRENEEEWDEFFWNYELMIFNVQQINKLNDWSREKYIDSINYYIKNRDTIFEGDKTDYYKIYIDLFRTLH